MPRYDYKCPDGHVETWNFSLAELKIITDLEEEWEKSFVLCWCLKPARRVLSAVPAIFRGGGWASKS